MTKVFSYQTLFLLIIISPIMTSCSIVGAIGLALHSNCKVKVNKRCVKGTCEVINGVSFERLSVLEKDSTGMPLEFVVTERFKCYNPGTETPQKFWPDKIYFNKINGHYKWVSDTVKIHYRDNKVIYSEGNVIQEILDAVKYDICPNEFHSGSWYRVHISDPRIRRLYLYVDQRKKFHVFKFNSGLSPI